MNRMGDSRHFSFLIHDLSRMRRTYFDQALKPLGITRAQWWALGNISRHSRQGMMQTELAKVLEAGKVSVGGLIDRLEDSGLVYRQPDKTDRRVKRVFITERGFKMLDHISSVGEQLDGILFRDISDEELTVSTDIMLRLKHNVREALKRGTSFVQAVPEGSSPATKGEAVPPEMMEFTA